MAKKLKDIVEIFGNELDILDMNTTDLLTVLNIDTAKGKNLDLVASIANVRPRTMKNGVYSEDDTTFRDRIKKTIEIKNSSPARDVIIEAVKQAAPGVGYIDLYEDGADILIFLDVSIGQDHLQRIKEIVAAGVGLQIIQDYFPPFATDGDNDEYLGFCNAADIQSVADLYTAPGGGHLSGVLTHKN
ncbi:MAG: hypothetical protein GY771_07525 [bacterium]|nr:hypothetical protein [bacterium]